jgi:hypothetical protein
VAMAREVMGLPFGDPRHADHVNRNRLDNRRSNLRVVSLAQNNGNRRYVGVSWHKGAGRWRAYSRTPTRHLGYFNTRREALAVVARFNERACQNEARRAQRRIVRNES